MMGLLCAALWGMAAFHAGCWCTDWRLREQITRRLARRSGDDARQSLVLHLVAPLATTLVPLCARLPWPWVRTTTWLREAGRATRMSGAQLCAESLTLAMLLLCAGWLLPTGGLWIAGLLAAGGAALPWCELRASAHQRQRALARDLEQVVTLLGLLCAGGMELPMAVMRITESWPATPLRALLQGLRRDLQVERAESAWQRFAERAAAPGATTLVSLVTQALRLGSPVAPLLRALAEDLRRERFDHAEQQGAWASQKILLPVVCCILPAYFLLTFGGLAARLLTDGWRGLWS